LQGGDVKDALRSAFVGGATGAVTAGFSGPNKGLSGFGQNIATDVSTGTTNIGRAFTEGSFKPLTSTSLPSLRDLTEQDTSIKKEILPSTEGTSSTLASADGSVKVAGSNTFPELGKYRVNEKAYTFGPQNVTSSDLSAAEFVPDYAPGAPVGAYGPESLATKPQTMFDKASNFIFGPDDVTPLEILKKEYPDLTFDQLKGIDKDSAIYLDAVEKAANASPGFIRRFGPSAALGIAGLSAAGAFDVPEQESIIDQTGISGFDFNYNPYVLPTFPFQRVAEGGEIFPRRNGGISPREGTPGKDSVRAMLMPGEFVMTTDAVKGLGGGNLDKGIKNMYSVMSKLEKRGKAMA
jgi:hypothetical protein